MGFFLFFSHSWSRKCFPCLGIHDQSAVYLTYSGGIVVCLIIVRILRVIKFGDQSSVVGDNWHFVKNGDDNLLIHFLSGK